MQNSVEHIIRQLQAYKKKYYLNMLIKGILISMGIIMSIFLIINSLELGFQFNSAVRTILFFLFIGVLFLVLYKWILLAAWALWNTKKQLSDEEAARQIGKYFPEVSDKLLNVLQLRALSESGNALILASINQKSQEISWVPFSNSIQLSENKKYLKYALPPILVSIVLLLLMPQFYTEGTKRLVQYNRDFLPELPFNFLINSDLTAFKNDDYTLDVHLTGNSLPAEVYLITEENRIRLEKKTKSNFEVKLPRIQKSKKFYLEAAGWQSSNYEINVIERPDLSQLSLDLVYPRYLQKSPQTVKNIGNVQVPEGTEITWNINAQASEKVIIHWKSDNSSQELTKWAKNTFSLKRTIRETSPYEISLENNATKNKNQLLYQIEVIKDQYPSIELKQFQDTILYSFVIFGGSINDDYGLSELALFYRKKSEVTTNFKKENIALVSNSSTQSFYYQWITDSVGLKMGDEIEYYLQVWDNDGINGRKFSRSQTYTFKIPDYKETKESLAKAEKAKEKQLDKSLEKAKNLEKQLNSLQDRLKGKKEMNWQDEKLLQDLINKRKEINEEIEKLQELNKNQQLQEERFDQRSEALKEKAEELRKLMDELLDEETKKLYEELQKLMEEQMDINKVQEQLKKIINKEQNLEKELERSLELFKKMKLENQLEQSINKLEELSQKQEELSKETETASKSELEEIKKEQDQLRKEFKELQEELDQAQQLNQDLKNPMSWDDTSEEEKKIQESLEKSQDQLQNGKQKEATKQQKESAKQMQQMKQKLEQMKGGGEMEALSEDLDNLRDIMDNLIKLSFAQEDIMKSFREVNNTDPRFLELSKQQLKIKSDAQIVEDSLTSLANRVFQIKSFVTREVSNMNQYVDESIEAVRDRNRGKMLTKQQFAMSSMNNLALMLDDVLDQMQQQMSDAMGAPKKGKKNSPSLSQLQQQLNQQIQQLQKGGKNGKELSEQLAQMAAEQERIRELLKEHAEKEGQGSGGNLNQLMKQMEQTENDLVNKRLTQQMIKRQQDILTRLLESENAQKEREEEETREAQQAKEKDKQLPKGFEEYINQKKKEVELYKTIPPKFTPYYKNEVTNYFKSLKESNE